MGRTATGVRGIKLADGDYVIGAARARKDAYVLSVTENGYGKRTPEAEYRVQSRGGKGIKAMQLTDKTGPLSALMLVREDEDVMLISDDGTIIRMAVADISTQSRSTQGVRLMRLADSSRVVAVTTTEKIEETDEEASADASAALPEADPNDPDTAAPDDLSYAGDEDRDIARLLERAEEDGDI